MSFIEQLRPSRPEWTLSDRLAKARRHADYTQSELASRLGLSLKQVQRFEQARIEPRRAIVLGWAMACGVDAQWLEHGDIGFPAPPPPPPAPGNDVPEVTKRVTPR